MAVKRRTIWLDDAEWADVLKIAEIYGTTVSRAIAKGMVHEVREPKLKAIIPPFTNEELRYPNPLKSISSRAKPFLRPAVDRAMQEFRPVPKPGKR